MLGGAWLLQSDNLAGCPLRPKLRMVAVPVMRRHWYLVKGKIPPRSQKRIRGGERKVNREGEQEAARGNNLQSACTCWRSEELLMENLSARGNKSVEPANNVTGKLLTCFLAGACVSDLKENPYIIYLKGV